MYVGLKQPRGDGERYVTSARAASKETTNQPAVQLNMSLPRMLSSRDITCKTSGLS